MGCCEAIVTWLILLDAPLCNACFFSKDTQSPAKHRYPPLIVLLKDVIKYVEMSIASKRGKTKGPSLHRSCQEGFLIRPPLFDTEHQKAAVLLVWCAVSKMHAGLRRECFETCGSYGVDWNQTTSEHVTFVLFSFLFILFFFCLKTDTSSFMFAMDLKPELIGVVPSLKPDFFGGEGNKPTPPWAIKHSEVCGSSTAGCSKAWAL